MTHASERASVAAVCTNGRPANCREMRPTSGVLYGALRSHRWMRCGATRRCNDGAAADGIRDPRGRIRADAAITSSITGVDRAAVEEIAPNDLEVRPGSNRARFMPVRELIGEGKVSGQVRKVELELALRACMRRMREIF